MPLDPESAVTAAFLARLRADAGVTALVAARVYYQPPAQPDYPYLVLGRVHTDPFGGGAGEGAAEEGTEATVTLTAVSRYGGTEEAKRINGAVRACLHDAAVSITDWTLVNLRVAFADTFRAADWRSTYGVTRLRAVVEPQLAGAPA